MLRPSSSTSAGHVDGRRAAEARVLSEGVLRGVEEVVLDIIWSQAEEEVQERQLCHG